MPTRWTGLDRLGYCGYSRWRGRLAGSLPDTVRWYRNKIAAGRCFEHADSGGAGNDEAEAAAGGGVLVRIGGRTPRTRGHFLPELTSPNIRVEAYFQQKPGSRDRSGSGGYKRSLLVQNRISKRPMRSTYRALLRHNSIKPPLREVCGRSLSYGQRSTMDGPLYSKSGSVLPMSALGQIRK